MIDEKKFAGGTNEGEIITITPPVGESIKGGEMGSK